MEKRKKLLFVATECQPFLTTGGLGEVIGSLPKAIKKQDKTYDVRVILPLYLAIADEYRAEMEFLGSIQTTLAWRTQYCGVFKYVLDGVIYYFIDNEYYFKRNGIYGHYDDGERFAFFSKSVLDVLSFIDFVPDVIHSNDWQTALVPIYYSLYYGKNPKFYNVKNVFSIHNIEYQGKYSLDILEEVFDINRQDEKVVEFAKDINLMKGAIVCADVVATVSPSYANEMLDPYYSHGLHPVLAENRQKIVGILNGIDISFYNPKTDKCLFARYSKRAIANKKICKTELQKMLGLPVDANIPMIGIISRLVSHKGLDLIKSGIEDILSRNVQLVILGKGDAIYENFFYDMAKLYSDKMSCQLQYNQDLSRKIYSGCDIFLMPSKSEPCGLAQMICSRYGTVPIVRETGGLKDSIKDIGCEGGGNGFTFNRYLTSDLLNRISAALMLYTEKEEWSDLVYKIMDIDFSWKKSAKEYMAMYNSID